MASQMDWITPPPTLIVVVQYSVQKTNPKCNGQNECSSKKIILAPKSSQRKSYIIHNIEANHETMNKSISIQNLNVCVLFALLEHYLDRKIPYLQLVKMMFLIRWHHLFSKIFLLSINVSDWTLITNFGWMQLRISCFSTTKWLLCTSTWKSRPTIKIASIDKLS